MPTESDLPARALCTHDVISVTRPSAKFRYVIVMSLISNGLNVILLANTLNCYYMISAKSKNIVQEHGSLTFVSTTESQFAHLGLSFYNIITTDYTHIHPTATGNGTTPKGAGRRHGPSDQL